MNYVKGYVCESMRISSKPYVYMTEGGALIEFDEPVKQIMFKGQMRQRRKYAYRSCPKCGSLAAVPDNFFCIEPFEAEESDRAGPIIVCYRGEIGDVLVRKRDLEIFTAHDEYASYYNKVNDTEQIIKDCLFIKKTADISVKGVLSDMIVTETCRCPCCGCSFEIYRKTSVIEPQLIRLNLQKSRNDRR